MPPANYIAETLQQLPCNASDVTTFWFPITTPFHGHGGTDSYDSAGAMKFIITTLLVYSLLGISGMLLLRIRRRASRTHRVVTVREENLQQYIKRADDLKMAGHRYKLRMDTSRMVRYLHNLERQRSIASNDTSPNDESTSLLSPIYMTGQDIETIASPKVHPNSPSCSFREVAPSSPLPEYYNDVTWQTSRSRTSLCKTCIALSGNSSKKANTKNTSVEKPNSDCSDDSANMNNEAEPTDQEKTSKERLSERVLVSDL